MHEEPLHLLPGPSDSLLRDLGTRINGGQKILLDGDLCPSCRFYFRNLMQKYSGDLKKVLDHVRFTV